MFMNSRVNFYFLTNISLNILATIYIYQSVLFGKNYGDASDGTVQMVLHEHWWRWINGKTSFLDTEFFYPFDRAFGYSDVFLIQGPIHVLFRFFGFDMFAAWTITTFIFLLFGNIGWAFLSTRILTNKLLRILFSLTMVFSSSFVGYFQSAPNIVGYAWLSWFAILLNAIYINYHKNNKRFNILVIVFFNLIVIYAMSCWYGTFFLIATLIIFMFICFLYLLYKGDLKSYLIDISKKIDFKIQFFGLPTLALLVALFVYIYIPVQGDPYRPVSEMLSKSPRLIYLLNGAHVNDGGFLKPIYEFFKFDSQMDMQLGIGFITFSLFIIIIIAYLLKLIKSVNFMHISLLLSSIILFSYFAVWPGNFSIHSFLFDIVPGLQSIRVPVRYVIVLGYVSIFIIFVFIDNLMRFKKNRLFSLFCIFLSIITLFDQFRFPNKGWDKSMVINENLLTQESELKKNCDYFYYDAPGGWWYDQVVAMAFSYSIDLPTTNGNSGAYPPKYPVKSFVHEGDISGMINWIKSIDISKRGCITNGELPIYILAAKEDRLDIEDGFTPVETDGKNTWQWAVKPNASIFIFSGNKTDKTVQLEMANSTCTKERNITISTSPEVILQEITINNVSRKISIKIPMKNNSFQKLLITTSDDPCKVEGDPRNLFYEIKNLEML